MNNCKKARLPWLTLLLCPVLALAQTNAEKRQQVERMIADFSSSFSVPEVDAGTAKTMLNLSNVLFLDAREPKEAQVSIIPNAITKQQFEAKPELYKNKKIIVYCTIGYRSSKYAGQWNKRGYQMTNLRGSLLLWTHENGPLVDQHGKPTRLVHTYAKKWNLIPDTYQGVF